VTAQDLRVAQGYVRCGRCSNVFNALARLSEDRNAAAAASASQTLPAASPTGEHPTPAQPEASPTPPAQKAPTDTPSRQPQATGSFMYTRPTAPPSPAPSASRPPPASFDTDDDDSIPEDALEFNPAAADVNQVFVEPPPNPEWTAATGTFKSIILKSDASGQSAEIELDPDFLSSTAEMRKLKMGLGEADTIPREALEENNITGNLVGRPTEAPPQSRATSQPQTRTPSAATPAAAPAGQAPTRSAPPRNPPADLQPSQSHLRISLSETQSQPQWRPSPSETQSQPRLRISLSGTQSQPQLQHPSSADTQSQPRPSPADTQTRARLSPTDVQSHHRAPSEPDETSAVTRPQPHKTIRAFGLDSAEPPPDRLAALARSRVAPGSIESPTPHSLRLLADSPVLWGTGVGALGILLLAQIVNHYRNDLAATPTFNKPITALYSAFGVRLTPRWDLRAYDVRQLGASVDAANAGEIMVRASIKNGGHQAQPLPLLRVTLQDRFGNRIAARDVAPGNYLPHAIPAASFLSAGQRIDAEMAFVDPGSNAVGFEIDACLPAPAGGIACANDPAP